jgi:ketosteroid isomerase-like protein
VASTFTLQDFTVIDAHRLPPAKDQCKNDGWRIYGTFRNQVDCVSFVATGGKNPSGPWRRGSHPRDTGRAMSQENLDVLRRMLRAFNERDVQAIVAECDPAVVWEEQFIPGADPVYRGHAGVRRWAALVVDQDELASLAGRLERIEEADDTVMASVCFEGEGTSSGVEVAMRVHLVFTIRDGKVVRRQVFQTFAEALEAVGLSE